MIEQAINWLVSTLMILCILYLVYYNAVQISAKWKCRKKRYMKPLNTCHESDCKFAQYCEHYERLYTSSEIDNLRNQYELPAGRTGM